VRALPSLEPRWPLLKTLLLTGNILVARNGRTGAEVQKMVSQTVMPSRAQKALASPGGGRRRLVFTCFSPRRAQLNARETLDQPNTVDALLPQASP
jgi:hypothetical protein